jgi:DNA-binding CsgD family transcriptional regulator
MVEVDRGRRAYAREAWLEAYEELSAADRHEPLGAADLRLFATSAYMIGRESGYLDLLQRAHRAHLASGERLEALRCAFWLGIGLAGRGEIGRAGGWLGRAQRLLEECGADRVERGYLLLPVVFEQEASGELEAAATTAAEAATIGREYGDADLFALAAHEQGHVLIRLGRGKEGLRLLDEAMVAVTAGELSPIVSGIVYCGVILACRDASELRRAQEWTAALSDWCDRQPDLVAFTGRCLTHRAELLHLHGAWVSALEAARRAEERSGQAENPGAVGEACYRRGEIHRTLGQFRAAEEAYREASRNGREPQPGLALLRSAQGKVDAAAATIRRALAECAEPGRRAGLLPAFTEIALVVDDVVAARAASDELSALAQGHADGALRANAARARGAVELAEGDPAGALVWLRRAAETWRRLEAPYEVARARELLGLACRALDDEDSAALELDAARTTYAGLGAVADLARVDPLVGGARREAHGLTNRELEVLRLVAAGKTNKAIAARLVVSERTVDRHVSNILAKLRVSSRAAATASAYEHGLL